MRFISKKLYNQFLKSDFYLFCVKTLQINVRLSVLPNKYDLRDNFLNSIIGGKLTILIYKKILSVICFPLHLYSLIKSDIYMHEYSNQIESTFYFYLMSKLFKKRIFVYHHGHTINIDTKFSIEKRKKADATYLNFHEHNNNYVNQLPYKKQVIIGYPKFYKEWKKLIIQYNSKNRIEDKYVLIFTRAISHAYMDKDKYEKLLITSYNSIRNKVNDIKIIIKKHPREDDGFVEKIINTNKMKNIYISNDHAGVLSRNALFVISFWTSAILDSISFGIPSVEYYIESNNFRKNEPKGSVFKNLGIESVDNDMDLNIFIKSVLNNNYKEPDIYNLLSYTKNLNFIN